MVALPSKEDEKSKRRTHSADIPWKTDEDQIRRIKLSKNPDEKKSETTGRKEEK